MELQRIKNLCEKRKGGLRGLATVVGMTEQNLHRCIRENKIQAQDLEKIAHELSVNVGYFFDEEVTIEQYHAHGERGFVAKEIGYVDQRTTTEGDDEEETIESLRAQVDKLQKELLKAKDRIIELMENRK